MGSTLLSDLATEIVIPVCAVVGIVFSLVQWVLVSRVKLSPERTASSSTNKKNGYNDYLIEEEEGINDHNVVAKCAEIQNAISEGATSFLFTEYQYVGVFMVAFAILIFLFLGSVESFSTKSQPCTYNVHEMCKPALATAIFSTISFLLGAVTSVVSGFLGMKIATYANARTTLEARKGVGKAFITAFRSGAVMGFLLAANGLLVLYITINLFKLYYGDDWEGLFEAITGYGLGGSSMALFGRVGGGIYTKAADVGADLVGKVERNIPEDDPRNPAVIADNVGDNVGDIAGMGSDLFGSYAESSCAALVVASISSFGINHEFTAMCYPLLISSVGIIVCLITTLFATDFFDALWCSCWLPRFWRTAISASNTGGAWDNAKKYIEAGASEHARTLGPKGSEPHKAAVIGDTIGDPLKDTSGPSLNILIKLMAVESLVFAPFFATHGGLLFKIF
ncbi:Pyrophosphate-energized vacuolar membrane proton pump (H(+)-PPase) like [Actinidia chinensis var. chinensis]|uniref:H(+)-exporting diphosphatase n=1 Tax=Actinidia chinensis var. chinensis TaxID=1590841 RepID=A0A2R6QG20_ACTCC|nr:Pyrophosphate-energized vacuolar membrane proton pump (H(+)-PPase) like [Actinidia chinensis var. chinensis]